MKYISILLVSTAAFIAVEAKDPFFHPCKQDDPKAGECIKNTIMSIRPKLVAGIRELEVPTLDPLGLDDFDLDLGTGISVTGKNIQLTGLGHLVIENMVADFDAGTFAFDLLIPNATSTGNYVIVANIASILFKGNGPMTMSSKSVHAHGVLRSKKVSRRGKIWCYFSSMDLKVKVSNFDVEIGNLFDKSPEIGAVLKTLLTDGKEELLKSLTPPLEKSFIKKVLSYANNVVKHYTCDELFPK